MPARSQKASTEELCDAIRNGNGVSFECVMGGVKYRAVLSHRDAGEHRRSASSTSSSTPSSNSRSATSSTSSSSANSPVLAATRQSSEQTFDELDKHWNQLNEGWR